MAVTMTCNRCGASMTGSAAETIKWDQAHDEFCPAPEVGAIPPRSMERG